MAEEEQPLSTYRRKRDFSRTAEPRGDGHGADGDPVFVVQIHDARSTHFDFRLEADGVLKSWAIPKGPSDDPSDKRLAMPTEDHPMEYRDFEGVIEPGEYGGGTVIVWDTGTFRNASTDRAGREIPFARALERGHASFRLNGHKLRGRWALTRFRPGAGEKDDSGHAPGEAWLLVKKGDSRRARSPASSSVRSSASSSAQSSAQTAARTPRAYRGTPDPARARSVRTGRTLAQVAEAGGPVWHANR